MDDELRDSMGGQEHGRNIADQIRFRQGADQGLNLETGYGAKPSSQLWQVRPQTSAKDQFVIETFRQKQQ